MIRPRRIYMPVVLVMEVVLLALLVAALPLAVLSGLADRRLRAARLITLAAGYLLLQWGGLITLGAVALMRPFRTKLWWTTVNTQIVAGLLGRVVAMGRRTLRFHVVLEAPSGLDPLGEPDPVVAVARHGGPGDSFVLVWLLAGCYRRPPRVVLKEALRWEPLLDVALTRLGAVFLPPPSRRTSEALADEIGRLAAGLSGRDALLLFPEGGNWTPARRRAALRHFRSSGRRDQYRTAALMENVLPPRPAGVSACVAARPDVPLVVVAHAGLDRLTTPGLIWSAIPFGCAMTVRWWPPAPVPGGDEAVQQWLTTEWAVVDEWIDLQERC